MSGSVRGGAGPALGGLGTPGKPPVRREASLQELTDLAMQVVLYVLFQSKYNVALTGSAALALYMKGGAMQQPRDLDFCVESPSTSRRDFFAGNPDRLEPTSTCSV